MKLWLIITFLTLNISLIQAQGIRGTIYDETGAPMPYASVYVQEVSSGTAANAEGKYELQLQPGTYNLTFQFVGFQTLNKKVEVRDSFELLDVQLKPQAELLKEAVVTGSTEDPAYSILRKAIAKAPYHLMQCDSYTARVYIKGTGGLSRIPGMFQKMAAKQGVDTSRAFTSESVSEISFERPAIFKERVISVRTSGEDLTGASPNAYINTSFYLPKLVGSISPFSPRAFSYYRFRYLGNFTDRGFKIHKIEVKPRTGGDYVFSGHLFIRDEHWNIHSLDLNVSVDFLDFQIRQYFAPVEDDIWMPVSQQYTFSGSMMGFAGEYHYMASVINYQIVKNEELAGQVKIVDEKIEGKPAEIEAIDEEKVDAALEEVFEEEKEVSRQQFRELMEDYAEEERENAGEEDVLYDKSFAIDSMAAKKDSAYWAEIRPVPLTDREKEGYRRDDSTYAAENDSSTSYKGKFDFGDVLFGGRYELDEKHLRLYGLLTRSRFNTVEGFNFDLAADLSLALDSVSVVKLSPSIRYGFASHELYARLNTSWQNGPPEQRMEYRINGGHYIFQFYPDAINPLLNSVYSLMLERNFMKLYEQDYLEIGLSRTFRYKFSFDLDISWSSRSMLYNNTSFSVIDWKERSYSDNFPDNIETSQFDFQHSRALTSKIQLRWKPWLKFRRYNGELIPITQTSPEVRFEHIGGWEGVLGSEVKFHRVEAGLKSEFDLGVRAAFIMEAVAGTYLNNDKMLFMDYRHFRGGLTEFAPLDLTGRYRAIDYYLYSTNNSWLSLLSHVRFRKLLITRIPIIRMTGIKENIVLNYLKTSNSPHYYEIGYGIDNIFRLFRLEFVQGFANDQPARFVVRVGVASIFKFN